MNIWAASDSRQNKQAYLKEERIGGNNVAPLDLQVSDNEYLETMRMRMRGLPDFTKGQQSDGANSDSNQRYDILDAMDTQEIINKAQQVIMQD